MYDAVVVGGGPAGLAAAVMLGRCRRRVLVVDAGQQRNARAMHMHGYLTRDGIAPREFLGIARAEVASYEIKLLTGRVVSGARHAAGHFELRLDNGEVLVARKVLLATGVRDVLPQVDGLDALYGKSVHHCPYCDGWEHREKRLVALGRGDAAIGLALSLKTWSADVVACCDGESPTRERRTLAELNGVRVRTEPVVRLEGQSGLLERVHFDDGEPEFADALFFNTDQVQRSDLPRMLGCDFKENGGIATSDRQCTGVPGLYLAGDAEKDVQFVLVAAAEGVIAATSINRELQEEDRKRT